jgi:hypothetical protein
MGDRQLGVASGSGQLERTWVSSRSTGARSWGVSYALCPEDEGPLSTYEGDLRRHPGEDFTATRTGPSPWLLWRAQLEPTVKYLAVEPRGGSPKPRSPLPDGNGSQVGPLPQYSNLWHFLAFFLGGIFAQHGVRLSAGHLP